MAQSKEWIYPLKMVDLSIVFFVFLPEGNLYSPHFHPIASGIINEPRSKIEFPPLFQEQLVSDFIGGRSMEWW